MPRYRKLQTKEERKRAKKAAKDREIVIRKSLRAKREIEEEAAKTDVEPQVIEAKPVTQEDATPVEKYIASKLIGLKNKAEEYAAEPGKYEQEHRVELTFTQKIYFINKKIKEEMGDGLESDYLKMYVFKSILKQKDNPALTGLENILKEMYKEMYEKKLEKEQEEKTKAELQERQNQDPAIQIHKDAAERYIKLLNEHAESFKDTTGGIIKLNGELKDFTENELSNSSDIKKAEAFLKREEKLNKRLKDLKDPKSTINTTLDEAKKSFLMAKKELPESKKLAAQLNLNKPKKYLTMLGPKLEAINAVKAAKQSFSRRTKDDDDKIKLAKDKMLPFAGTSADKIRAEKEFQGRLEDLRIRIQKANEPAPPTTEEAQRKEAPARARRSPSRPPPKVPLALVINEAEKDLKHMNIEARSLQEKVDKAIEAVEYATVDSEGAPKDVNLIKILADARANLKEAEQKVESIRDEISKKSGELETTFKKLTELKNEQKEQKKQKELLQYKSENIDKIKDHIKKLREKTEELSDLHYDLSIIEASRKDTKKLNKHKKLKESLDNTIEELGKHSENLIELAEFDPESENIITESTKYINKLQYMSKKIDGFVAADKEKEKDKSEKEKGYESWAKYLGEKLKTLMDYARDEDRNEANQEILISRFKNLVSQCIPLLQGTIDLKNQDIATVELLTQEQTNMAQIQYLAKELQNWPIDKETKSYILQLEDTASKLRTEADEVLAEKSKGQIELEHTTSKLNAERTSITAILADINYTSKQVKKLQDELSTNPDITLRELEEYNYRYKVLKGSMLHFKRSLDDCKKLDNQLKRQKKDYRFHDELSGIINETKETTDEAWIAYNTNDEICQEINAKIRGARAKAAKEAHEEMVDRASEIQSVKEMGEKLNAAFRKRVEEKKVEWDIGDEVDDEIQEGNTLEEDVEELEENVVEGPLAKEVVKEPVAAEPRQAGQSATQTQPVPAKAASTKLICFDFDMTIVKGHFHSAMEKEFAREINAKKQKLNDMLQEREELPGMRGINQDDLNDADMKIKKLTDEIKADIDRIKANPKQITDKVISLLDDEASGLKNPKALVKAIQTARKNGHKIAITSWTLYPEVVKPTLERLLRKDYGLTQDDIDNIFIVGGFPTSDDRLDPYGFGYPDTEKGKSLHIEKAMEHYKLNKTTPVVLIDDSAHNFEFLEDGQVGILVPREPKPDGSYNSSYLTELEKHIQAPAARTEKKKEVTSKSKAAAAPKQPLLKRFVSVIGKLISRIVDSITGIRKVKILKIVNVKAEVLANKHYSTLDPVEKNAFRKELYEIKKIEGIGQALYKKVMDARTDIERATIGMDEEAAAKIRDKGSEDISSTPPKAAQVALAKTKPPPPKFQVFVHGEHQKLQRRQPEGNLPSRFPRVRKKYQTEHRLLTNQEQILRA